MKQRRASARDQAQAPSRASRSSAAASARCSSLSYGGTMTVVGDERLDVDQPRVSEMTRQQVADRHVALAQRRLPG